MPRTPKLPIVKTVSGKWRYDLPPSMAQSGRRQRKTFDTKKQAELSRLKDMERQKLHGVEGFSIPSSLATQAVKAVDILKPTGATIVEAATAYLEHWTLANSSKTFLELWAIREDELTGKSDNHKNTNIALGRNLTPILGDKLVCDIGHEDIRKALTVAYPTAHGYNLALRNLRPAFGLAVREGWATANPCDRLKPRDTTRNEIAILTLNQSRKVMASALDYSQRGNDWPEYLKVDATGATAALALMLFAGVRPAEVARLDWENVNLNDGTVFVSAQKSKTDRSRFFDMPDTLKAWLATVPVTERTGAVVPLNWKKCWQAIRREAGISDQRDQLRKTFASCHLQAFNDVKATRAIMGHEVGDVLFTNYRGLVSKAEALNFWEIVPGDNLRRKVAG